MAMQVDPATGQVHLLLRSTTNFRQRFEMETSSFGGRTFRLVGTNVCLATPAASPNGAALTVASCASPADGRIRWYVRSGVPGNGAYQLKNAKTAQIPMPNFFGNRGTCSW
jgi:hypothetical protein